MLPSESPMVNAPSTWRHRLGHSAVLQGFIGAVLAVPVMMLAFLLANAWLANSPVDGSTHVLRFWLVVIALPAILAVMLYRIRQWLLSAQTAAKAYVIYAVAGAVSPFLTWGLMLLLTQVGLALHWRLGGEIMLIATIVAGFAIGFLSSQAERRWT